MTVVEPVPSAPCAPAPETGQLARARGRMWGIKPTPEATREVTVRRLKQDLLAQPRPSTPVGTFAALLAGALAGASISEMLGDGVHEPVPGLWDREPLHPKVAAVAAGSFVTKELTAIRGSGYIVDALEAALWALHSTSMFADGVLAAVNLGDDADTTAAIYGQLAGAASGLDAIAASWRDQVLMRNEIIGFADELHALAL